MHKEYTQCTPQEIVRHALTSPKSTHNGRAARDGLTSRNRTPLGRRRICHSLPFAAGIFTAPGTCAVWSGTHTDSARSGSHAAASSPPMGVARVTPSFSRGPWFLRLPAVLRSAPTVLRFAAPHASNRKHTTQDETRREPERPGRGRVLFCFLFANRRERGLEETDSRPHPTHHGRTTPTNNTSFSLRVSTSSISRPTSERKVWRPGRDCASALRSCLALALGFSGPIPRSSGFPLPPTANRRGHTRLVTV